MSKPEKTIDLTPTWVAAVRIYMAVLEAGNEEGKRAAREDLTELAQKMDAFNKVNWSMITEAAEIRGQQWRAVADGVDPSDVVDELHEALRLQETGVEQFECINMAELIEAAVTDARKFFNGSKS
jgi:hypothetical protein